MDVRSLFAATDCSQKKRRGPPTLGWLGRDKAPEKMENILAKWTDASFFNNPLGPTDRPRRGRECARERRLWQDGLVQAALELQKTVQVSCIVADF